MELKIHKAAALKPLPADESKLGFGSIFTDHMFAMNYTDGQGWHDARIVPYGPVELDPAAMVLHYGQEVFEGMKAYRTKDGSIQLFRPEENFKRLNNSNDRLCIPRIDEAFMLDALKQLVRLEERWVPHLDGCSLYIRPFIFATDAQLGVHTAKNYLFLIILSPVGAYYKEGLNPVKIYIETKYVRAVPGGMGMAKTGGNYAASLKAQEVANGENYSQVLWLDGIERKYIEEVGAMNVFFKIGGEVLTPTLSVGSILPGITRKSSIELLKSWGIPVKECRISVEDLEKAYADGRFEEAFGTGTAAVISPIGELKVNDVRMTINGGKIGPVSQKLYDTLTGIQWGKIPDTFGWTQKI
ncbi:MAG: branched-chain amino acid aminotransferase [Oscillospiraceae bacterium]|nr:branched-chain amino acid aminotransferase [Oscillospiraceae bacterium]